MRVTLLVHLEPVPEAGVTMWWAESPDVPGFSATNESLTDLRAASQYAITQILQERGVEPGTIDFDVRLVGGDPVSQGEAVQPAGDLSPRSPTAGTQAPTELVG